MFSIFSNKINNNKTRESIGSVRGFTLIEIIISLGIFAVVAVIAIGALLKVLSANKKAQSVQDAVTNLNFAMDTMLRDIRTGSKYDCTTSVGIYTPTIPTVPCDFQSPDTSAVIAFRSSDQAYDTHGSPCIGSQQFLFYAYRFIQDPNDQSHYLIEKAKQDNACSDSWAPSGSSFQPIVSSQNVKIASYSLKVIYDSTYQYPLALIHLTGIAGAGTSTQTVFNLQTAASSRQR